MEDYTGSYYSSDDEWNDGPALENQEPAMDGVILIDLEPHEPRVTLCDGHHMLPSTAIGCLENSLKVRVRYRRQLDGSIRIDEYQDPSLMQFRCPCFTSFENGGTPCNVKYPLEVVANQIPAEFQEEFDATVRQLYKLRVREAVFQKIPSLQECPNHQCLNEGIEGVGQVISAVTWNMYCKKDIFMVPRKFVRECRSCGWVWCAICKVRFFTTGETLNHNKTTCRDLVDLSDPNSAESLSKALIDQVAVKCPGCRISVAVSHGCNRICCSKCKKHFCYLCRDVAYTTSDQCYNHLKSAHGSYWKDKRKIKVPAKGEIDRVMVVQRS